MSNFHIIIAAERRTPQPSPIGDGEDRSRLAIAVSQSVPTGNTVETPMGEMPEYVSCQSQLHIMTTREDIYSGRIKSAKARELEEVALILQEQAAMGITPDFSDPQYVGVFEWDGNTNYVIQHKGDYSTRTMSYAGWPAITKEQWEGAQQVMEGRT